MPNTREVSSLVAALARAARGPTVTAEQIKTITALASNASTGEKIDVALFMERNADRFEKGAKTESKKYYEKQGFGLPSAELARGADYVPLTNHGQPNITFLADALESARSKNS